MGKFFEESLFYSIKKYKNQLTLTRGSVKTMQYILSCHLRIAYCIIFLRKFKSPHLLNILKTIIHNNEFLSYEKKKLKSLCFFLYKLAAKKEREIFEYILKLSQEYELKASIIREQKLSECQFRYLKILRLFNFQSFVVCCKKLENITQRPMVKISELNFISHNFKIMKKTALITKVKNLNYNLEAKNFKGVFKELVSKGLYKVYKNVLLFPPISL